MKLNSMNYKPFGAGILIVIIGFSIPVIPYVEHIHERGFSATFVKPDAEQQATIPTPT